MNKGAKIRKFVVGTEEAASKWQNPKDWMHWSLDRVSSEKHGPLYFCWIIVFFGIWALEQQKRTLSDMAMYHYLGKKNLFELLYPAGITLQLRFYVFLSGKVSRRTIYKIRQVIGFPSYRGRAELINKWRG